MFIPHMFHRPNLRTSRFQLVKIEEMLPLDTGSKRRGVGNFGMTGCLGAGMQLSR